MTPICTGTADTFRCPTKWELWRQIMALLPRGRAWQSHEQVIERWEGGENSQVGTFESGVTPLGAEPTLELMTTLEQYWASYAELLEYFHQRACALIEEYFCATTVEQRIEWGVDYGFPDPCEPWDTLCEKVAAQGGATCAYIAEVAASRGYAVACVDCSGGAEAGCDESGLASPCLCPPGVIVIRIYAGLSPAVTLAAPMEAGAAVAGCTEPCPPAPDDIVCLIERIKPAHVRAIYEVVP